ncbi:hypothetical protein RRF57_005716 [Xylaria bambusicola]|uniref:Uncharacterized protein n=1 Tax=Xylaria bambusicola TaxID=326684 RepID=A0AAN7UP17_9PEZI
MSHLTLRRSETPPGPQVQQQQQQAADQPIQDSPTIGRAAPDSPSDDFELLASSSSPLPATATTNPAPATATSATTASTPSFSFPFTRTAK